MGKPHADLYGIPVKQIADICKVDLSTARRWKRGAICPPEAALMVLRIKWHGDLSDLGPEWHGWRYRGGEFTSPDGWAINRNHALSVPLMHGQIDALRQKIAALEADPDVGLENQPEPGELPNILTG